MELSDTTTTINASETSAPVSTAPVIAPPAPWSPLTRIGFRLAFLYFFCFIFLFGNGTLFGAFPVVGDWVENKLNWPFNRLAEFTGQHLFHITGIAAHWHATESGDTAMNWIQNGLFVVFALAGCILWTILSLLRKNPRTQYQTLNSWLRFLLRLSCAMFMIGYGLAKVFPFQMPPPSVGVLNEPVGNLSPMTLLWNTIGLNPVYEIICGSAEVLGGMLLLYRRTALAGAIISAFVMTNVVLYNFFFDVPVKLFAANLLIGCMFLALPDSLAIWRFFWSHEPAAPTAAWVPRPGRRAARIAIVVTEIVFAVAFLVVRPIFMAIGWHHQQVALRTPSPLLGDWHVDEPHAAAGGFVDPDGHPVTDLYVEPSGRAYMRSSDGELWIAIVDLNAEKHTVGMNCYFISPPTNYSYQVSDPNHITLTSLPPQPPKPDPNHKPAAPVTPTVLTLTRTPTPTHYPLLERGFHFINEWRYER